MIDSTSVVHGLTSKLDKWLSLATVLPKSLILRFPLDTTPPSDPPDGTAPEGAAPETELSEEGTMVGDAVADSCRATIDPTPVSFC